MNTATQDCASCPCRVCGADTMREWGVEMEDRPERSWLCRKHFEELNDAKKETRKVGYI